MNNWGSSRMCICSLLSGQNPEQEFHSSFEMDCGRNNELLFGKVWEAVTGNHREARR